MPSPFDPTPPSPPAPPPPAWSAEPRTPHAPRRSPRGGLHLALFLVSCATMLFAGASFWVPPAGPTLRDWLAAGAQYAFPAVLILGAHEMGHYLACRYYGISASLPYFIPGVPPLGSFGALIRIRAPIPDRRALFDVAAAGPIAGFLVCLPILTYGIATATVVPPDSAPGPDGVFWVFGDSLLVLALNRGFHGEADLFVNGWFGAGWVGLLVTSLNLFPVGQLDGGHAVYAFSRPLHRLVSRGTLVALGAMILYQAVVLRTVPGYLLWFGILLWMRDRHPRVVDESDELGPTRRVVAFLLLVIFAASFIFVPLRIL